MSLLPLCWTYMDGEGGELTTDATYVVAPAALAAANVCFGIMWLVAAAILTMYNLTTVAILAIFSSVGSWRFPSASSTSWHSSPEEDLVTQFVVLGTRSTRLCLEKPLDKFGRSPSAVTHGRMVFAMEAREGPNTSR